jgi:hypothetical protein
MGRERILLPQVKALCPLSTAMFGSKQVEMHHCIATLCANGSIHIYCVLHQFKGFISLPSILEAWNVKKVAKDPLGVRPVR